MCDDEKLPKKPEEKPPITENSETNETIDLGTEINKEMPKVDKKVIVVEENKVDKDKRSNEKNDLGTEINKEIKKEDIAKKSNEKNNDGV
jgi:hypothetical protein